MSENPNRILDAMLERLFASLINGPSLNCRPHNSRQRVDFNHFSRLKDVSPTFALWSLITTGKCRIQPRVEAPLRPERFKTAEKDENLTDAQRAVRTQWQDQESVFTKLRAIAEDGRIYEQDTGVHVLNIGFPLLSLPPGTFGSKGISRRIIAPIAFIPVSLVLKQGAARAIELECRSEGADLVTPNVALFAWLEQQTGKPQPELFNDEKGEDPWRELRELVTYAAKLLDVPAPDFLTHFSPETPAEDLFTLRSAPRADDQSQKSIIPSAIFGLFPVANQGLLRDTQALAANPAVSGPIESFIQLSSLVPPDAAATPADVPPVLKRQRSFSEERLISHADPCQARAVRMARQSRGLVVHGPPGTGKSQTITNIIGDHLARGERVLFVCDKRTALDVVFNRLQHLGLGHLCAVVHDPQRDQRELYKSIRTQLEELPDARTDAQPDRTIARLDTELQRLHTELTGYSAALNQTEPLTGHTFHDLVGEWLRVPVEEQASAGVALKFISLEEFEKHVHDIQDTLERATTVDWKTNPWRQAAHASLEIFLSTPMSRYRTTAQDAVNAATSVDTRMTSGIPPFEETISLAAQSAQRTELAGFLAPWAAEKDDVATLRKWLERGAPAAGEARLKLVDTAQSVEVIKSGPLDDALFQQLHGDIPARERISHDARVLRDYLKEYARWAGLFSHIQEAAPQAPTEIISQWIAQVPTHVSRAKARLDQDRPLVDQIASKPIDRQLAMQFERQPFEMRQLIDWQNLVNEYVASARKWYSFLTPGPKSRCKPVLTFFGVPAKREPAERLAEFLAQLRLRLDLKTDLEQGIVKEPLGTLPTDVELIAIAQNHHAVVAALSAIQTGGTKAEPQPDCICPPELIHPLMPVQAAAAEKIVSQFSLNSAPSESLRLTRFLEALDARLVLTQLYTQVLGGQSMGPLAADDTLMHAFRDHLDAITLVGWIQERPAMAAVQDAIHAAAETPSGIQQLITGLKASPALAEGIEALRARANAVELIAATWVDRLDKRARALHPVAPLVQELLDRMDAVESVLRIQRILHVLPPELSRATADLIEQSVSSVDGANILRRAVLAGEIGRILSANPQLQAVDGQRLKSCFERYQRLENEKRALTHQAISQLWLGRQRERLLALTGSRLNGLGAELKRRLTIRGERAMRLRQVISVGQGTEGGDPLFDLRPIWMASPETVAQLFPREPLFDVVIFDEASQCRLEEALPVLTRARRVVIAGDSKQLPPTRFFESAVVSSEDEEIESDQQLFETQQSQIEDLLAAALNLEIEECYLDVHYRSRNSDLIQFSNEYFYGTRLQPIPGHPSNIARYAPITLYHADGLYKDRSNDLEAAKVCQIVRDLLRRAQPPSIGIACFNLQQRDLIVDKLDELANEDAEFARALGAARARQGAGSFEGLFVKNLESVQGDERDHMIISTTYGPDEKGRFYQRFGPLGRSGGGRRLNVLVTRAREEVHLVTSIPREVYRGVPPVPPGQMPGGGWLLFGYLSYAERLAEAYEAQRKILDERGVAGTSVVNVKPTRYPSLFSEALGKNLCATHRQGADIHWGNDGFCVDLALHHPTRADDVTIGVLCDMSRYALAEDPVEWDIFRTGILQAVGWQLNRVWSPHFFRDQQGRTATILNDVREFLMKDQDPDTLKTVP